jgi:hypothetical protein
MSVLHDMSRSVPPPKLQLRMVWVPASLRSAVALLRHVERRTLLLHSMPLRMRSDAATAMYTPIDLFFKHPRNRGGDVFSKAAGRSRRGDSIAFHEYRINLFFQAHYWYRQSRIVLSAMKRSTRQESALRSSRALSRSGGGGTEQARRSSGIQWRQGLGKSPIQRSFDRASRALSRSEIGGAEKAWHVTGIELGSVPVTLVTQRSVARTSRALSKSEDGGEAKAGRGNGIEWRHIPGMSPVQRSVARVSRALPGSDDDGQIVARLNLEYQVLPHRLTSRGFTPVIRHDRLARIHPTRIEMTPHRHQVAYAQSRPVRLSSGGSVEVDAELAERKARTVSTTAAPYTAVDQLFRMGLEKTPVTGMTLQEITGTAPSMNRSGEMKSAGMVEMDSAHPSLRSKQEIELIADKVSRLMQQRNRFEKERRGEF